MKPDLLVLEEVSYTMFYSPEEERPRASAAARAREEMEDREAMARRLAESPRPEVDPSVKRRWDPFINGTYGDDTGSEYVDDGSSSRDTSVDTSWSLDTSVDASSSLDTSWSLDTSVDASSSDDVPHEKRDAGKGKAKEKEEEELEVDEVDEVEARVSGEQEWKRSLVEVDSDMSMLVNCFMLDRNMNKSTKCLAALKRGTNSRSRRGPSRRGLQGASGWG
ncbi:hypothetical protein LY474_23545 [Myxococcus stipitatus]|uniref:hypothetical protein n=1 Tax=Myxococcus stipitatus TaxID=83455 RepID=UPI001F3E3E09|nr:hypothetical protein [Myxococcus stipitatus]MCE9670786.1 hypothetical protein [Myxococcus stipitatus]